MYFNSPTTTANVITIGVSTKTTTYQHGLSQIYLSCLKFQSNYISGVYDAATIKLNNISNTGQYDEAWNKNESVIR